MQSTRTRLVPPTLQEGVSPRGCRTFGIPETGVTFGWCGHQVEDGAIVTKPRNGHFQADSRRGFGVYALSLPNALLEEAAHAEDLPEIDALLPAEGSVVRCPAQFVGSLRDLLGRVHGEDGCPGEAWEELLTDLPGRLLRALAPGRPNPPPSRRTNCRPLRRALEYIDANPRRAIGVAELARACGGSERTLRDAFRGCFDVSPKTYLQAVRLNGARRDLRAADPEAQTVTGVAQDWGFWHMGRFAADYRRLFGERPSQTLGGR